MSRMYEDLILLDGVFEGTSEFGAARLGLGPKLRARGGQTRIECQARMFGLASPKSVSPSLQGQAAFERWKPRSGGLAPFIL